MHPAMMFVAGMILTGAAAAGGIYKSYDKSGNPVYTDSPSQGSRAVEPRPMMTMPSLPKQAVKPAGTGSPAVVAPAVYALAIQRPKADDAMIRGAEPFKIEYSLEPVLWPQHHLEMLLDGNSLGRDNLHPEISPQALDPGQHRLLIQITDAKDNVMTTTSTDFFILLPGRLNRHN